MTGLVILAFRQIRLYILSSVSTFSSSGGGGRIALAVSIYYGHLRSCYNSSASNTSPHHVRRFQHLRVAEKEAGQRLRISFPRWYFKSLFVLALERVGCERCFVEHLLLGI